MTPFDRERLYRAFARVVQELQPLIVKHVHGVGLLRDGIGSVSPCAMFDGASGLRAFAQMWGSSRRGRSWLLCSRACAVQYGLSLSRLR